jgi:hypothetical protein
MGRVAVEVLVADLAALQAEAAWPLAVRIAAETKTEGPPSSGPESWT